MSGKEFPDTMTEENIQTIACQRKEVVSGFLMKKYREECHAFKSEHSLKWNFERNLPPLRKYPVLSQFQKWITIYKLKLPISDTQFAVFIRNIPIRNLEKFAYKQFRCEYMNYIFAQLTHSASHNSDTNVSSEPQIENKLRGKLEPSATFTGFVENKQDIDKDNRMNATLDNHKERIEKQEDIEKEHDGGTDNRLKELVEQCKYHLGEIKYSFYAMAIKCRNSSKKVCLEKTENLSLTENMHAKFGGTSFGGQHTVTEADKSGNRGHGSNEEPICSENNFSAPAPNTSACFGEKAVQVLGKEDLRDNESLKLEIPSHADSVPASYENLAAIDKQHENSLGIASSAKMELKTKCYTSSDALPNQAKGLGLSESSERSGPVLYGGNTEPKSQQSSKRLLVTDSSAPKKSRKTECSEHELVQPCASRTGGNTEDDP